MKLVLDASMALAWIFDRTSLEERDCAERLLVGVSAWQLLVPAFWHVEVANGLLVGCRRGLLTEAHVAIFLQHLYRLAITTDPVDPGVQGRQSFERGMSTGLSAYDSCYLELALRQNAVLASFDRKLVMAARQTGVRVLE